MSDYIDLVLCRVKSPAYNGIPEDNTDLFCAPRFSHLKEGQMVVVDTEDGEMTATVIKSVSMGKYDNEELDFILTLAGKDVKSLRRVISEVQFKKLYFDGEEEDEQLQ